MIAYFTASIVGKKNHLKNYQMILNILKKKNITCIADHILNTSEEHIKEESKQERLTFQSQLETWLGQSDFIVAETSHPSVSVGYEISLAQHRNKPVLILYTTDSPPSLLAQHKDERLVCERYTERTLEGIIDDFIHYLDGASDTRFTFFITSSQNAYLDRKAKQEKLPKSVYLRKLIENDMHGPAKTAPAGCPLMEEHDTLHKNGHEECFLCKAKFHTAI